MTTARKPAAKKPHAVPTIGPATIPAPTGDDVFLFHPDELTVGQMEDVEVAAGVPFDWLYAQDKPKAAILRAIAYVLTRETDPTFTMEQARDKRVFIRAEPKIPPTVESA